MTPEERAEAIFGSFDGTVSVIGLIFGLAANGQARAAIATAGVAAAVSATVSMGTGEFEKDEAPRRQRLHRAGAMALATVIGSLIPVWPFFVHAFSRSEALWAAGAGSLGVALWIGRQKSKAPSHPHAGVRCYLTAVAFLAGAAIASVAIVGAIPASAG